MLTSQEMWAAGKKATQQTKTKLEEHKAPVLPLIDLIMILPAWPKREFGLENYKWSCGTATADLRWQVS